MNILFRIGLAILLIILIFYLDSISGNKKELEIPIKTLVTVLMIGFGFLLVSIMGRKPENRSNNR